jgi:hypothetical protein
MLFLKAQRPVACTVMLQAIISGTASSGERTWRRMAPATAEKAKAREAREQRNWKRRPRCLRGPLSRRACRTHLRMMPSTPTSGGAPLPQAFAMEKPKLQRPRVL